MMKKFLCALLALSWQSGSILANPAGATVSHGTATIANSGPNMTITASDRSLINWQSFNIGLGQTTTFIQPSSSSIVWNRINDPNPSQILGHLNANGYVVLQSQAGFYIGGQATITTHGLIMTTAPIPMPDLASGDAWHFNSPPPTASIINYGQISVDKGGSLFLIAHDVENKGTMSAPNGNLGLFAGKEVLVSERPDGRGLTAKVTLPVGSVDNSGKLIADAGTIAMHAQVVNQGGLVQANSVRERNGTIELVAGDAVNLGADSVISARGDSDGPSPGGSVTIKSGGSFSDVTGSAINIAGGASGGKGGQLEISASDLGPIQSAIDGHAADGYQGGQLTLDPVNLTLTSSFVGSLTPVLSGGLYQINLQADNDITVATFWNLPALADPAAHALLTMNAGNNIIFKNNSGIKGANNWNMSLFAGTAAATSTPESSDTSGNDLFDANGGAHTCQNGIYLNGNASIQSQNGDISLWAANEVMIYDGSVSGLSVGSGSRWNGIRSLTGGNISVTTLAGDVNSGANFNDPQKANYNAYLFGQTAAPYYRVSPNIGGISTVAGGNVTISAGGNVISYLPEPDSLGTSNYRHDGGSGAFGPQPGNVTITAGTAGTGGTVIGHYVVANGVGTVTSVSGNVGVPVGADGGFALSLIKGSWSVYAPKGSIYVQDVRNPNGVFNDTGGNVAAYAGYHYFDYDSQASVLFSAQNSVEFTGSGAPHDIPSAPGVSVPLLFPPSLTVKAGHGGFVLDSDVTLFPSPYGDLNVTTLSGGNFQSRQDPTDPSTLYVYKLIMSDSGSRQFDPTSGGVGSFGITDHADSPVEVNNPDPVRISISGSMNNIDVYASKASQVSVNGDMFNSAILGQNLHAGDTTSIRVNGTISYPAIYSSTPLGGPISGADPQNPTGYFLGSLVENDLLDSTIVPAGATLAQLRTLAASMLYINDPAWQQAGIGLKPGFSYDPTSLQLVFQFRMAGIIRNALDGSSSVPALEGKLQVLKYDQFGHLIVQNGDPALGQDPTKLYFATTTVSFVPSSVIDSLYAQSQHAVKDALSLSPGFQIGGPGVFSIRAGSMDLGSSSGILAWGAGNGAIAPNGINYAGLRNVTDVGADVSVDVAGDLSMLTSTIASIGGGDVAVKSGGSIGLSLGAFSFSPPNAGNIAFGIFTSGHSDVSVTAERDINIGSARIGTFNGGDVFVESQEGSVNAGNGANRILNVPYIYINPLTGLPVTENLTGPAPFGSGIVAIAPSSRYLTLGGSELPGNITVDTPHGDIVSTLAGIQQFALGRAIEGGRSIVLDAGIGPDGSVDFPGNVDLGAGGVVGINVNINAGGNVQGLIVSRQNSTINAAQSFSGTVLSGGTASLSAGGTVSGTVVGIGGVSASGGSGVTATLLSQNVSVSGGQSQSTLGTSASATSSTQAAAQQSTTEAREQVAQNTVPDDEENKKKGKGPVLTRRVGRVTVLLPPKS